jgi:Domain of unknown function (DUF4365)
MTLLTVGTYQQTPAPRVTTDLVIGDYQWGWQSLAIDPQTWQGHYGESVVHAMACAAGLVPTKRSLDVDGVDYNILHPGRLNGRRHPAVDVQVKSWSTPSYINGQLAYPLLRKNYDNLVGKIGKDFPITRLLLLVIVPANCANYMSVHDDRLILFHRVHWISIMHYPTLLETENVSSKTIYIPTDNFVTPDRLRDLLCRDFEEEATQ